jgi:hypothetical protein
MNKVKSSSQNRVPTPRSPKASSNKDNGTNPTTELTIHIIVTLEQDGIHTLVQPFISLHEAKSALSLLRLSIRDAADHRHQIIGYPKNFREEEDGEKRWESLLQGLITEEHYDLSMWSPDELCIIFLEQYYKIIQMRMWPSWM